MNRKKFLQLSSMGIGSLSFTGVSAPANTPIVIATWDSGKPVNAEAWKVLETGGSALDAVETGAKYIEGQTSCCVGLTGFPDRDGIVTLDASIMDHQFNCGAVAGLERIKHPISVARRIMEKSPHVLLVGAGAQQFARENGFPLENGELSKDAKKAYEEWKKKSEYKPVINIESKPSAFLENKENGPYAPAFFEDGTANHDTMGLLALDKMNNFSGAVTTSGMAFKIHGRSGDSPIVGAGLFVDNEVGAATSSGVGEEVIRICGTHLVVELMRQGYSPEQACKKAVERIVKINPAKAKTLQVGFIAIDKKGRHGAYSIQTGFMYALRTATENRVIKTKFLI